VVARDNREIKSISSTVGQPVGIEMPSKPTTMAADGILLRQSLLDFEAGGQRHRLRALSACKPCIMLLLSFTSARSEDVFEKFVQFLKDSKATW
jgi:hypothetical protein